MKGKQELVYRIKKSLYDLKQYPRTWYQKFESHIQGLRFKRSQVNQCVYIKQVRNHFIYVALYVGDMLLVGNNMDLIKEVKQQLSFKLNMNDFGPTYLMLGMEIKKDRSSKKLWLSQQKYIEGSLKRFNMQDCKLVKVPIPIGTKLYDDQCPKSEEEIEYMAHVPYASAVSCLMYAMVYT